MERQAAIKIKLLKRLISTVSKEGFQHLRMEDIAKYMDVSRATMYKYFSSKEEVIEGVVDVFVNYIQQLSLQTHDDSELSYGTRFQKLFEQTVLLVANFTDVFLRDLQAYPESYERLQAALRVRGQQSVLFYQEGTDNGVFNHINSQLLLLQDELLIREIFDIKYLLIHGTSLKQVLYDFYTLKKIQLFKADKLAGIDDTAIHPAIDHIVAKYNKSL